jgi:hypothetical protein
MKIELMIRCNNENPQYLHLQGKGKPFNRGYGVAANLLSSPQISEWVGNIEPTLYSLATSDKLAYVPCDFIDEDGDFYLEVQGPELNRSFGMRLKLDSQSPTTLMLAAFARIQDDTCVLDIPKHLVGGDDLTSWFNQLAEQIGEEE